MVGNNESGISNSTGGFSSGGPNDFCRVQIYQMTNSGDSRKYTLQVVYAKSDRVVSYTILSLDGPGTAFAARAVAPIAGISVDIFNRRITFNNVVLGAGGSTTTTVNGTLEYETNANAADRTSCG